MAEITIGIHPDDDGEEQKLVICASAGGCSISVRANDALQGEILVAMDDLWRIRSALSAVGDLVED